MLIQPSVTEFARVMAKVEEAGPDDYDMKIVNNFSDDSALVLPHRLYSLLVAEFRDTKHSRYLGSVDEEWDPIAAFHKTKFLH